MLSHSDVDIQHAVVEEIDTDPRVDEAVVGVLVRQGVVTLTGFVDADTKRLAAEHAARRVTGVRAVVNHLEVKPSGD